MSAPTDLDVLVVGAGIAGLWTACRLQAAGHVCALVEQDALGAGQTRAAQGIIHGGLKYALGTAASIRPGAIAAMPARWRACLEGRGELDLSGACRAADACWLWADRSLAARLATTLAPRLLRGRAQRVEPDAWPPFLRALDFDGLALRLDELVIDVPGVLRSLAAPLAPRLLRVPDVAARLARDRAGIRLELDDTVLRASSAVLCAGAGNAELRDALGLAGPAQRLRPLHQVCVETAWPEDVFGHCLTGSIGREPGLTITSHAAAGGRLLYLGGTLATEGVARDRRRQIDAARRALAIALPGAPLADATVRTLRVDRAEPARRGPRRLDQAKLARTGAVLTAWPMKLALAPDLADRVLAALPAPGAGAADRDERLLAALARAERPAIARSFACLAA